MSDVDFLVGETVVEVRYDNRIVFRDGGRPEPRLYADVGDCVFEDATGGVLPLSALIRRTVASASTENGVLGLAFSDRTTLRSDPQPEYEAWQVVGGDPQYLVVCLPAENSLSGTRATSVEPRLGERSGATPSRDRTRFAL